jgi:hypothetical protein
VEFQLVEYMTGSYSRMRFNSPLNGYLYAFRIGVQKYFISFFLCSHIDNTIPFNVYFQIISNEVTLIVNDPEISYKVCNQGYNWFF